MTMSLFWLAALIVFGVVEAVTVGLASIWFAAGALVALVISALNDSLWLQIVAFAAVSLISMLLARPLARKYLIPKVQPTNADRIIGAEAVVTEEVDNLRGQGLVSVAGNIWSARSDQEHTVIPLGTKVRVLRIEGVKVFVTAEDASPQPE